MNALSSLLGRRAPTLPLTREELDLLRERAWQEHELIVMHPSEFTSDYVRQGAINDVVRKFGKRMKR